MFPVVLIAHNDMWKQK